MSRVKYLLDGSVRAVNGDDTKELARADKSNYQQRPPAESLPSFGEEYDSCGEDYHNFCSSCGKPEIIGKACQRADCPRCWAKWCVERATKITAKLEERRQEVAYRRSGHSPKFHHVVLTFPKIRFASEDPEKSMFELCKNILGQLGTFGGVLLYHAFRGADGSDIGFWKTIIGEDTTWNEVEDDLAHEEHVHALVLADTVDKMACKGIYEDTGINVHRVEKDDSNVSLYNVEDLAGASAYSLSHAHIGDNRAGLRYFGSVAQTSPDDTTEARANAAVRSIAEKRLGVPFSDLSCTSEADSDHSHDHDKASCSASSGDSEPSESASDEDNICGGRMLDIHDAPRFLSDDGWISEAEYSADLKAVWQEYKQDNPPPSD